ncbi:MAG: ABC transporter substrate-binding protein [Candidatus Thorarchaeota archaeon]
MGILYSNTPKSSATGMRSPKWSSQFRPYGAYVDEIEFIVFTEGETSEAILALEEGDVDAYDDRVEQDYLVSLINNPEVQVTFSPSNRYRALTLNCERFPLNITAFRRAMAFGFDKYRANTECIMGFGMPLDSYFPITATEWAVESQLNDHFYEADFISGNRSLENAGFIDLDGDGWREYDKNSNGVWNPGIDFDDDEYADGDIIELYPTAGYEPAIKACEILQNGLVNMGVRSKIFEYDSVCPLCGGLDYGHWIDCWTEGVPIVNPPKLLYDNFRTGGLWNNDYYHFSNSTIDAVLDKMVNSTTIEDIKKYATEATKLLVFEQPQIVCYNDVNIGAYRTDKFDGWFEFSGIGISSDGYYENNPYCGTKVYLKEDLGGPWGGTLKYCLSDNMGMGTLNPYLQKTAYEKTVFQYIYERLWNIDPNTWDPIPGLAYDWEIDQTTASGDIRDGQKFTFHLYNNETWHDGEPFTAADVNHSIYKWKESPYHEPEMEDIYKIEMPDGPDGHIIELYVNETGYLEFADTTAFYITPEHIWKNVENVISYNPDIEDVYGTGPYILDTRLPGEYITLKRNENWRWALNNDLSPTLTASDEELTTMISSEGAPTIMTSLEGDSTTLVTSTTTPGFTPFLLMIVILALHWFSKKKDLKPNRNKSNEYFKKG